MSANGNVTAIDMIFDLRNGLYNIYVVKQGQTGLILDTLVITNS
jgi:hypothetical protein